MTDQMICEGKGIAHVHPAGTGPAYFVLAIAGETKDKATELKKEMQSAIYKDFPAFKSHRITDDIYDMSECVIQIRRLAGMDMYVVVARGALYSKDGIIMRSRHVYVKTYIMTPNNGSCSSIGEFVVNKFFDTNWEADEFYVTTAQQMHFEVTYISGYGR